MRNIFIFILCITSLQLFSQDNYPANNKIGSLEKNLLFNAQGRYMVNQTGAASLSLDMIFDGKLYPSYTTLGIPTGDSTVITIEGLPGDHVQRGAWIGWTTRYWGPSKFKIEVYNIYSGSAQNPSPNQWHKIVNQENYTGLDFAYFLPGNPNSFVIPTKIRFTFYSATGTDGRLGISELFYINNESVAAYDGLLAPIDKKGNLILGTKNNQSSDGREDLRIYETRVNEKASLKVGYDSTRSLEIYRPSGQGDIFFKSQQANIGHMRFETNNSSFSFSGGKVGIGTTLPNQKLHVAGYGQFDSGIVGNTAGLLLLGSSSTPLTNSVFLTSGGAMGIGVQNGSFPTGYKLAVAGNVIADKIKVKKSANGAWPDFVFDPHYKLPDLFQIESFVKQNKHLPEIPSAIEIERDGHDLGEMNRLLLKKVEELTLYMIEMKKENDKLKLRLDRLER